MDFKAEYTLYITLFLEAVKFMAAKKIAEKEQFKILHDINVSLENTSKSQAETAEILYELLKTIKIPEKANSDD